MQSRSKKQAKILPPLCHATGEVLRTTDVYLQNEETDTCLTFFTAFEGKMGLKRWKQFAGLIREVFFFFFNKNLKMNRGGEAILRVTGLHCGWGIQIHNSGTHQKTANPWTMDHCPSSSSWPSYSSPCPLNLQPPAALPPSLSFGPFVLSESRRR